MLFAGTMDVPFHDAQWRWGVALAASTAGTVVAIMLLVWGCNHFKFTDQNGPNDGLCPCFWRTLGCRGCWTNKHFIRVEFWSAVTALLHFVTIGLGWMVIIWGGILIGALFRTLNDVDYWWLFGVWMTENLTKYMYMHPEGDFYRKFSLSALHSAARHNFNRDCCDGGCKGISVLSCFDSLQLAFAVGRTVVAGMALQVLSARKAAGQCRVPNLSPTHNMLVRVDLAYMANTTGDPYMIQFDYARACAALTIFYLIVLIKGGVNICKMILVVCMADIGGEKYRADGLVSILVHEQHGFTMSRNDVELALVEGKHTSFMPHEALKAIYDKLPGHGPPVAPVSMTPANQARNAAMSASKVVGLGPVAANAAGNAARDAVIGIGGRPPTLVDVAEQSALAAAAAGGVAGAPLAADNAGKAIKWWKQQHGGTEAEYKEAVYAASIAAYAAQQGNAFDAKEMVSDVPDKWPWA